MQIESTLINIILNVTISITLTADDISSKQNFNFPEACETGFQTSNWKDCANSLSTLVWNTHTCHFQWVWDAKFECRERAPGIIGEVHGLKIRHDAMKQDIAQTIEQTITFGTLTHNDFQCD